MLSENQIAGITDLLKKAGEEIMRIYRLNDFGIRIKDDKSPVTMADLAADNIIKAGLEEITPGIPVFSEETKEVPYSVRSKWDPLWILDPLDGTKEFVARNDEFCISLALVSKQKPVSAFIHAPVTGETWLAISGSGAYKIEGTSRQKLPAVRNTGAFRINISRTHHTAAEEVWIDEFRKNNEVVIEIIGSAIKFCKIAEGMSDIYPKFSPINEWDIAAGHLIIVESGGTVIEPLTGLPPLYNKHDYHQPAFIAFGPGIRDWKKLIKP